METPVQQVKYGNATWVTPAMDTLRVEHCMCLHCVKMKPGLSDHCQVAQAYFELCKANGNAFIMTRCMHWEAIV